MAVWIFALILLPAVVSALPALPSAYSYPPITINIGYPTGNTDLTSASTSSATTYSFSSQPAAEGFNANGITTSGNTIHGAGTLSVQHAAGSPSVSYNGNSAVIQADIELSPGASATCTLRRGNQEIVSKDCSSGTFTHTVREEGTYSLTVDATGSDNNRISIHTESITVQFD